MEWVRRSHFVVWQAVAQGVLSGMEYVRRSAPALWRAMGEVESFSRMVGGPTILVQTGALLAWNR
jgi:hypothetical protein